ncbi:uncharacterized protein LOC115450939 isoform X2 [Manduca sexta]|uniref:uncharacterized protein LOC115450939 isoform X2 n=1 Tax=Manduca sexta TaxID=7130 RepID=UPI00188E4562|nr:uncharacterized protein LOC115450939 isoform X2 [Manduca sexta]
MKLIIFCLFFYFQSTYTEWVAEWMTPIQDELSNDAIGLKMFNDEELRMVPVTDSYEAPTSKNNDFIYRADDDAINASLRNKLENTLQNAKILANTLQEQIVAVSVWENLLKEAIVNGRSGTTAVTVTTMGQAPRSYTIRDSAWTLCDGIIQYPSTSFNVFNELLSVPKCIGQEISSRRDPCVFSSVIKYETVPIQRQLEYTEDDYLCLKSSFNTTLAQYMSVTRNLINETCKNGLIRSLTDNIMECGLRVMSEYTFYPHRGSTASGLPLEYCTERDGSCKLIIAWHISNTTVENFEFLKNEQSFKKFFIKPSTYIEHF